MKYDAITILTAYDEETVSENMKEELLENIADEVRNELLTSHNQTTILEDWLGEVREIDEDTYNNTYDELMVNTDNIVC